MKKQLLQSAKNFLSRSEYVYSEKYKIEFKELESFYKDEKKLPLKIGLTEEENSRYDLYRLTYINKALDFLLMYYAPEKSPVIVDLSKGQQEFFESFKLINIRRLLEHIAFTIFNLSSSLRGKYKHLLMPAPFTWETFEQLGGLMKLRPPTYLSVLLGNIPGDVAKRFTDEYLAVELIVEAAVSSILQHDIPKLKQLFTYIINCEKQLIAEQEAVDLVHLISIKALTRRTIDIENLVSLLKYADNHCAALDYQEIITKIKRKGKQDQLYMVDLTKNDTVFARTFNLDTKIGQHAALRRLEKIGELITGKNFSSFLKDLDSSIDWQAFVVIRDAIAHQDERDNKSKIEALLKDEQLFKTILHDEMSEFFNMLIQIVKIRDKALPKFNAEDIEIFWYEVFLYEQKNQHKVLENSNKKQIEQVQLRSTKDDITFFMQSLKDIKAPIDVQIKWLGILNGKQSVPNKKEYGELLKHLPSRKDNKALYNKLKEIADKAINPRSDLASREQVREQQQDIAKQREDEQERKFKGLTSLRKFVKSLDSKKFNGYGLTRKQRIEAAIEALENIKEFMEKDEFVQANFNFKNIEEWEKNQNEETILNFFARLITNPEFNDAIEYNAAQLLQHLDAIRIFPESRGYRFLDNEYDDLRHLRNYIEHGNHLFDKDEYEPGKEADMLSLCQQNVGPIMITLIFELLPVLKRLSKSIISNRLNLDFGKIVAPVNAAPLSSFYNKKVSDKDKSKNITEETPNFVAYYLALRG